LNSCIYFNGETFCEIKYSLHGILDVIDFFNFIISYRLVPICKIGTYVLNSNYLNKIFEYYYLKGYLHSKIFKYIFK